MAHPFFGPSLKTGSVSLALFFLSQSIFSQEINTLQTIATQTTPSVEQVTLADAAQKDPSDQALTLTARDRAIAQMWGLSDEEMLRAKVLELGPRGSFSVSKISPLEILGIHARTPAERQKFAQMFARAHYEDVQRILAFQRAYDAEMARLTQGQPMFDFSALPKVNGSIAGADLMHVPRQMLRSEGAPPRQEQSPEPSKSTSWSSP